MAMQAPAQNSSSIDDGEWQVRVDLAAAYQLVDLYGWSDLSGTHISARVPGTDSFLINPYGMLFDEITASSLVRVDINGAVLSETEFPINPAGFIIHSAIHAGRPNAHCVLHTHTRAGNAVAMQEDGLLPLTQKALILQSFIAYHEYEGIAVNPEERARLVEDLGQQGQMMILRNHGLLSVGETVAEAFVWMHRLEAACQYQVDGLSAARPLHYPSAEVQARSTEQGHATLGPNGFARSGFEWPALLRKLERDRGNSFRS